MNNTALFQARLPEDMLAKAQAKAQKTGFSSLQDLFRLWLSQYLTNRINIGFYTNQEEDWDEDKSYLTSSEYNEIIRKAREEVKNGETYTREEALKELGIDNLWNIFFPQPRFLI